MEHSDMTKTEFFQGKLLYNWFNINFISEIKTIFRLSKCFWIFICNIFSLHFRYFTDIARQPRDNCDTRNHTQKRHSGASKW